MYGGVEGAWQEGVPKITPHIQMQENGSGRGEQTARCLHLMQYEQWQQVGVNPRT